MLGNHRCNNREEPFALFQRVRLVKRPIHAQGPNYLISFFYRHTDEGELLIPDDPSGGCPVQKEGLLANLGYQKGFSSLNYPARNTLAYLIFAPFHGNPGHAVSDLDADFIPERVQNGNGPPDHAH